MTDSYEKILPEKVNVSAKINKCHKKIIYLPNFLRNNDCETPYIDVCIDFLSIKFNLLSVLIFCIIFTIRSVILKSILCYKLYNS